jgi:hypothetical protein
MAKDERSVCAVLRAIVAARARPEAARWLEETLEQLGEPPERTRLRVAFARAGRELSDDTIELTDRDQAGLRGAGIWDMGPSLTLRDVGRAALLLGALGSLRPDEHVVWVEHMFRTGELGEQETLVRMLALLPDADRFADLAAEATRTNAVQVFAALACDNPYPARYLPELNFNQMVMKAIFSELPVTRIRGLADRTTPELVRMARDFGSERRAAGRSVPEDIAVIERLLETKP